jgi:hypothetical protein
MDTSDILILLQIERTLPRSSKPGKAGNLGRKKPPPGRAFGLLFFAATVIVRGGGPWS